MNDTGIFIAGAGLLLAGIIKGATGIGYSTCALPFLAVSVGLRNAIALVVVPAIVSNVATMWSIGKFEATARRFWPFYLAIVPGIAIGSAVLGVIDIEAARQLLGLLTLTFVGLAWLKPALALPGHWERPLALPAGFINGILTGLTGSQIMPLMPYFMSLRLDRDDQTQAINVAVTLASGVLAIALMHTGVMTPNLMISSCFGAIPAFVGVALGNRMGQLLSAPAFRQLSLATLAILALPLLQRTVQPVTARILEYQQIGISSLAAVRPSDAQR
jgi:uncharacterized membrane protein YfcA